MDDQTLEKKKKELRGEYKARGFGWIDGIFIKPSQDYILRNEELRCIDMINSILCYSCEGYKDAESVLEYEENSYRNYLSEYVQTLGREKVIGLIQEQIESIDHIEHSVFIDDEMLSYNSIAWKNKNIIAV